MLTNQDLILLLTELKSKGMDVTKQLIKVSSSRTVDLETLKFINDNRQLEVSKFYEMIRKNYNQKKSKLYKNLVNEEMDIKEVLVTLSVLLNQIVLYNNKLDEKDKIMFLKHSRANEISLVLNEYFNSFDISKAVVLLNLIKKDLKAFEYIK